MEGIIEHNVQIERWNAICISEQFIMFAVNGEKIIID